LTPSWAPQFASAVAALDISAIEGVPVIADPLPDDAAAVIDAANLAAAVRRAIADARLALAAKVSVVIDSGSHLHLDALAADVRLRASGQRLHVALGGDAASATPPESDDGSHGITVTRAAGRTAWGRARPRVQPMSFARRNRRLPFRRR
jgi:hypothetical protein